jgi:hypothetical protein
LIERIGKSQRIARQVPGKTAHDMAAQPFADGPKRGEGDHLGGAGQVQPMRHQRCQANEQRHVSGEAPDGERDHPAEARHIDQE